MVKVIVGLMGGSAAGGAATLATAAQLRPFISMLASHHIKELDTARVYNKGKSEELIGELADEIRQDGFRIATKAPGFSADTLSYDNVIKNCNASLKALRSNKIDLYYFHGPDRKTPLEESCKAIHQLHQDGKLDRFGISNFNVDEVEEIVSICNKNGWIVPSVYQGVYNPLLRTMESKLLPTLRKHSIAFYAYSPLGGGFFSRTADELRKPPAGGRMDQMKQFFDIYVNDVSLQTHDHLSEACKQAGISMKTACLRWLLHHSALNENDGIVLGGSKQEQMEENLKACGEPELPENVVASFDNMWKRHSTERPLPYYSL